MRDDDVFSNRHGTEDSRFLKGTHHASSGHHVWRQITDALSIQQHLSATGGQKRRDQLEQGGLTRPIRTDHTEYLAGVHGEAHVVDSCQPTEAFGDVLYLKESGHDQAFFLSNRLRTPFGRASIKAISNDE